MTNSQQGPKPSKKTLNYLRDLAMRTGESFTWPATQAQASKEIRRLEAAKRTPHSDRRREIREIRHDMATSRSDAARVRDEELRGYGSSASWGAER